MTKGGIRSKALQAEQAVEHVHEVELAGESQYTPALAIGGVAIAAAAAFAVLLVVSLAAYYWAA